MKPLKIYVIQSAHTDIGYTHPQEQIGWMYVEHYDRVLELCRKTGDRPETERFKWTCETFWQVENYLAQRPERMEEFLHYVRAGQIEITAAYLHFADMIDTDAYRRSVQLAVDFCKRHNVPLRAAMHCDINGWPWSMADILAEFDIPYFCSQVHIDNATDPFGVRGSVHYHWLLEIPQLRQDTPIRVPQGFHWVGPQNGKVLHWLNEHYLLGNVLGISSPQPFGADKTRYFYETDRLTSDDLYKRAKQELPRYVARLQAAGYPYDKLLLSTGGHYVDNSRPDDRYLEVIARWNAEHEDICLQTATLSQWFAALEAQGIESLPTYQVAWPDHWAHGLGSSTSHIAQARRTQRRRAAAADLVAQSRSETAARYLELALQQERLAFEHTFDAWSTSFRPEAPANHFQQIAKEMTFHRAELYLDEAIGNALRALPSPVNDTHLTGIHFPPGEVGEALRVIHFDAGDQVIDPTKHVLEAADHRQYALQEDNPRLRQFVASVPLKSAQVNTFHLVERSASESIIQTDSSALAARTPFWSIALDPSRGSLISLKDVTNGREWVAGSSTLGFGQLVHEAVVHPLKREAIGNIARWIQLGVATDETQAEFAKETIQEHSTLMLDGQPQLLRGEVFDALSVTGSSERLGQVTITWRNYHYLPLVELVLDWNKHWSDLPEAAYVAFPFAAKGSHLEFETGGGFFQPGSHAERGQIPGTVHHYYTIQRAARLSDAGGKLLWMPLDAPLVMPQEIKYDRWETDDWQWNGFLASMPVNHYWHTNFPTSQRGYIRLRYRIINPAAYPTDEAAIRAATPVDAFGWR